MNKMFENFNVANEKLQIYYSQTQNSIDELYEKVALLYFVIKNNLFKKLNSNIKSNNNES